MILEILQHKSFFVGGNGQEIACSVRQQQGKKVGLRRPALALPYKCFFYNSMTDFYYIATLGTQLFC